jgi:hypothetical protein
MAIAPIVATPPSGGQLPDGPGLHRITRILPPGYSIETSWRLHYLWNSANNAPSPAYGATSIQPGQAVHFNGAASLAVVPEFRVGVAGYFLRQLTDSKANGQSVSGSQEQVAGLGPGFLVGVGALQFVANAYAEFAVENRPRGTRVNAVVMDVW